MYAYAGVVLHKGDSMKKQLYIPHPVSNTSIRISTPLEYHICEAVMPLLLYEKKFIKF